MTHLFEQSGSDQVDRVAPNQSKLQWLVSVRDEYEFATAVRYGVDIIDLKEPLRGALAPVDSEFWRRAVCLLKESSTGKPASSAQPKLSAALGESDQAAKVASALPGEFSFAKAGPSGCAAPAAIRRLWDNVLGNLASEVELVAVAYADAASADCLQPEVVLEAADRAGLGRCLLDTFTKDGRSTLTHLGQQRLIEFDRMAHRLGIWWAFAGSVTDRDVAALNTIGIRPDCWAVRGDVCDQGRSGTICEQRMQAWHDLIAKAKS